MAILGTVFPTTTAVVNRYTNSAALQQSSGSRFRLLGKDLLKTMFPTTYNLVGKLRNAYRVPDHVASMSQVAQSADTMTYTTYISNSLLNDSLDLLREQNDILLRILNKLDGGKGTSSLPLPIPIAPVNLSELKTKNLKEGFKYDAKTNAYVETATGKQVDLKTASNSSISDKIKSGASGAFNWAGKAVNIAFYATEAYKAFTQCYALYQKDPNSKTLKSDMARILAKVGAEIGMFQLGALLGAYIGAGIGALGLGVGAFIGIVVGAGAGLFAVYVWGEDVNKMVDELFDFFVKEKPISEDKLTSLLSEASTLSSSLNPSSASLDGVMLRELITFKTDKLTFKAQELTIKIKSKMDAGTAGSSDRTRAIPAVFTPDAGSRPNTGGSRPDDVVPQTGARVGGGSVIEAQSSEAQIRKLPLSSRLRSVLETAADTTGVTARVTSGGQPSINSPEGRRRGARTGSTRHDLGNAADLDLIKDGRKLIDGRPEDVAIKKSFVAAAAAAGATGIGAGEGYMGGSKIHVGFGDTARWGGAAWLSQPKKMAKYSVGTSFVSMTGPAIVHNNELIVRDGMVTTTSTPPEGQVNDLRLGDRVIPADRVVSKNLVSEEEDNTQSTIVMMQSQEQEQQNSYMPDNKPAYYPPPSHSTDYTSIELLKLYVH